VSCEQITFSTNECKTLRLLLLRSQSGGTAVHIAFVLFLFPLSYPSPHPPWTTLSNLTAPSRSPLTGIDSPSPGAHLQTPCLLGSNCDISLVASSSSFHFHFIPFSFCLGPAHDPVERLSTSSASSATPLFLPVRHSPSPAAVSPSSTAVSSSSTAVSSAAVSFAAISSLPTAVSSSAVMPPFPHHLPPFLLCPQPLHSPLPSPSTPALAPSTIASVAPALVIPPPVIPAPVVPALVVSPPIAPAPVAPTPVAPAPVAPPLVAPLAPAPVPSVLPPMATTGLAGLPSPHSKYAPRFTDAPSESINAFLNEFDTIADDLGLSDANKVISIIRFTSDDLQSFWTLSNNYIARNWPAFRKELHYLHRNAKTEILRTRPGLQVFIEQSAQNRLADEDDLITYHCRFLEFSRRLRTANQLTEEEQDAYFFHGFHPRDCDILKNRLFAMDPTRPQNQAPDFDNTLKAAYSYIANDHFHRPSIHTTSDNNDTHFSMDTQQPRSRQKQDRVDDSKPPPEEYSLGDLIRKMHKLTTHDEEYVVLYAQCKQRYPNIAQELRKPEMFQTSAFTLQSAYAPWPQPQPPASTPPAVLAPGPTQHSWQQPQYYPTLSPNAFPPPAKPPMPATFQQEAPLHMSESLRFEAIHSEVYMAQITDTAYTEAPEDLIDDDNIDATPLTPPAPTTMPSKPAQTAAATSTSSTAPVTANATSAQPIVVIPPTSVVSFSIAPLTAAALPLAASPFNDALPLAISSCPPPSAPASLPTVPASPIPTTSSSAASSTAVTPSAAATPSFVAISSTAALSTTAPSSIVAPVSPAASSTITASCIVTALPTAAASSTTAPPSTNTAPSIAAPPLQPQYRPPHTPTYSNSAQQFQTSDSSDPAAMNPIIATTAPLVSLGIPALQSSAERPAARLDPQSPAAPYPSYFRSPLTSPHIPLTHTPLPLSRNAPSAKSSPKPTQAKTMTVPTKIPEPEQRRQKNQVVQAYKPKIRCQVKVFDRGRSKFRPPGWSKDPCGATHRNHVPPPLIPLRCRLWTTAKPAIALDRQPKTKHSNASSRPARSPARSLRKIYFCHLEDHPSRRILRPLQRHADPTSDI
jgi:hypothetical protein